ncbi:hypothetical protein FZI85_27595 [Mycobacterium sp. CBMA293]|uniref:DUF4226 domain-containing protein n=1 Tax=Mycolicibacterium sp. CBMA 213 TaxID=1968788 RepID=A0A1S6GKR3_9MYCO|nr:MULTISPECIES: hypothetical protein [unclassified Mycolicibacterium]AQS22457.1 hypothetical protein pCBMA213_2_00093 [Mycolicibacterium sp. CBMA 213]MUL48360.1 hypothetical protein [Mycolicibacterium sp. CBMA 360]MUL62372.1 hypothetical protein [Mycolicibacterium sp. CBMA 335]MUM04508.1 hypothetical protein [Mycolicibacterium sp. CBMA 213]MUM14772.1 hypothetical protein [Mycolicibacterium sp. CBMA 293]
MSFAASVQQAMAALQRGRALFGEPQPSAAETVTQASSPLSAGSDRSSLAATQMRPETGLLGTQYGLFAGQSQAQLAHFTKTDTAMASQIAQASEQNESGRDRSQAVVDVARHDVATMGPLTGTPQGKVALLRALRGHVGTQDALVREQQQNSAQTASNIRALGYGTPKDSPTAPGGPDDTIIGPHDGPRTETVDSHTGAGLPQPAVDPRNPFVGDERFGQWVDVVPPPYTGDTPPPPWTGHRDFPPETMGPGQPKGPAGPSGFYTPGGRPWADDNAPPMADVQEQYAFRMSGQDYTPYTRMVNGHQQQWVQSTYDAREWTRVNINGPAWAGKDPNPLTGELGGTTSGGLGGISPPAYMHDWRPISVNEIARMSALNPAVTYYVPNGCGGQLTFEGGVPHGGVTPPPTLPSMIAAP